MIPKTRLSCQHLATPTLAPVELVRAFCAMQAQEYEQAKWAVGLRTRGTTELAVEKLLADGEILRSHPMRGTHHFVARADLRWLMALMGPLMIERSARRNRELALDEKTLTRCMTAIGRALEGGHHLTRTEIATVLGRAKINTEGQRLAHIIYRAELESLVCSGRRSGKQITFALFDERVPASKPRPRDEAIADLAQRYVTTRSPATLRDFTWWCQLPAKDARAGFEAARMPAARRGKAPRALLLPPYDEYMVAYVDRSPIGTPPTDAKGFGESTMLGPVFTLDGIVSGSWRREIRRGSVSITLSPWRRLTGRDRIDLGAAAARYGTFVDRIVTFAVPD